MLTGIDHIIIGVKDLSAATYIFAERLGLSVSGGGKHPTGGTANRIIVIGDTYLELIAVHEPDEAQPTMLARLAKGEGYLNFVLASDDIEADSKAMRERGVSLIGPTTGSLTAPDGRTRGWSRVDVERSDLAQHYPFIIQHDSTGEERRQRLAGWTTPPEHPLGVSKVLSVTVAVMDLDEAAQRFAHIYGLQPSDKYSSESDSWDAQLLSFLLNTTLQNIELAAPFPSFLDPAASNVVLPEPGALRAYLQQFGESLCRITLAVENLAASRRYLDEHNVSYIYPQAERPLLWILPDQACGASLVLHEFTPDMPPDFGMDL